MPDLKKINIGIVAHADAGKTTLTEQILFRSHAIRSAGSVDDGTSSTDSMEIERRRGISVRSAGTSVLWKDARINIIDAPGHSDFLSEVERTVSVLDCAVLVVSAVEGVQPQTRLLAEAFKKAKLPYFVFINKLDRAGSDSEAVLADIEKEFALPALRLNEVKDEGGEDVAVTDCDMTSPEWQENAVLASRDDSLLDELLSGSLPFEDLKEKLSESFMSAGLLPVIFGSSKYGRGVETLLNAVLLLTKEQSSQGDRLCGRIFKVEHDKALGKAVYVRLFSGSIRTRDTVKVVNSNGKTNEEKIARIRSVDGRKWEDVPEAASNDIALVYGLSSAQSGDIIGEELPDLRKFKLSEPLMLCRVIPESEDKLPLLLEALKQLEDEDPALRLQWNREKQEAWVRLTGKIQTEVLDFLLAERWGLKVTFGDASVIYRETPATAAEGFEAYTMPKPCWAVVRFLIEPLPRGSGFQYECKVSPNKLPYRYQAHVETAVPRALEQGLMGWQVTDLKVTLVDGGSHHVHTHPLDFFVATPMGIMDGLRNTGTKLLEPILKAEFTGPEEYLGKAISLLTSHRGRFEAPDISNGRFRLEAFIPAAEAMDLPVEFAAATAGEGIYGSRFSHYEDCPEGMGRTRERIGVDPLDRPRFILAARAALTEEV